jgi:hypothetical protein
MRLKDLRSPVADLRTASEGFDNHWLNPAQKQV